MCLAGPCASIRPSCGVTPDISEPVWLVHQGRLLYSATLAIKVGAILLSRVVPLTCHRHNEEYNLVLGWPERPISGLAVTSQFAVPYFNASYKHADWRTVWRTGP